MSLIESAKLNGHDAWTSGNPTQALANAVPYLQAVGHTVLIWVWLDVVLASLRQYAAVPVASNQGEIRATARFYHHELPKIGTWLQVVARCDLTCAQVEKDES
ncbi:MAG: acyl-CoA dehydrogenase C-terminal domain-containing protein [Rhodoferax sp.]|jgi:butyryl-CoA dehydrogenase|uniref:acyl-CoA dehydrogenase C-terminal domain-containing protein n=1 Tax=Rhodoferax sp. TaxID=50421 RepID=UPI003BB51F6F|nr:acyl-CoA dehydrogenase C-terminal domain-containing protein [Rhodoferax sp.]